jgi:hypothetical protein
LERMKLPLDCYLRPTTSEFELVVIEGQQKDWGVMMQDKARAILRATNEAREFVYADLDILFLKPVVERLRELIDGCDIAFQSDTIGGVCCGFIYQQSNAACRTFWQAVVDDPIAYTKNDGTGDQEAANRLRHTINYRLLPVDEFYTSCAALRGSPKAGWTPTSYPDKARIIHANCVYRQDKEAVLDKYRSLIANAG